MGKDEAAKGMKSQSEMSGKDEKRAQEIGARIRQLRQKHNLTQQELSELVNVSASSNSRLETGKQMVSVFAMMDIAETLHTLSGYLTDGDATVSHADASKLRGLEKRLERFEESKRTGLIDMMENMLDNLFDNHI